jgi:hypothetical protein
MGPCEAKSGIVVLNRKLERCHSVVELLFGEVRALALQSILGVAPGVSECVSDCRAKACETMQAPASD